MRNSDHENKRLRQLLWHLHRCQGVVTIKYGDDGEMQCNSCLIDFRRDSIEDLEMKLYYGPAFKRFQEEHEKE